MTGHAEARVMRTLTADRNHQLALDDARTLGHIGADVMAHSARHAGIHPHPDAACQLCQLLRDITQHLDGGGAR